MSNRFSDKALKKIQTSAFMIVNEIIARYSINSTSREKKDAYNFYKNRMLLKPEDYLQFQGYNPKFNTEQNQYFIYKVKKKRKLLAFIVKCC